MSVCFGENLLTIPHFENEEIATYLTELWVTGKRLAFNIL